MRSFWISLFAKNGKLFSSFYVFFLVLIWFIFGREAINISPDFFLETSKIFLLLHVVGTILVGSIAGLTFFKYETPLLYRVSYILLLLSFIFSYFYIFLDLSFLLIDSLVFLTVIVFPVSISFFLFKRNPFQSDSLTKQLFWSIAPLLLSGTTAAVLFFLS